eukprot:5229782-Amphidinium_carterae.1
MSQEMKSIEDRGRQAAEARITAFYRRSFLRSAERKSAEQLKIEKMKHKRELILSKQDAA